MDRNSYVFKWLWMVACFGYSNNRIWEFLSAYNSFDEAYSVLCSSDSRRTLKTLTPSEHKNANSIHYEQLKSIISYCNTHNIGILCFSDTEYPQRLKNIFNPPAVLFYRGDVSCLNNTMILAVVGTRNLSEYSENITSTLAARLAQNGITVASGFAVGTDIAAHMSAVRNGGKTIAVLGCGIDYNYPQANLQYTAEIEKNGVFVSEYYPKTAASALQFPARNRILAGLSLGTVVIEASEKSGALNTASHTLSNGRDIFVIPPHDILSTKYFGNIRLLHDGAIPVYSISDILNEYFGGTSHRTVENRPEEKIVLPEVKGAPTKKVNPVKKAAPKSDTAAEKQHDTSKLSEAELKVYKGLEEAEYPMSPDSLCELVQMEITDVLVALSMLEIEGYIRSDDGQSFYIT